MRVFAERKSDGKRLLVVGWSGDEICVLERFTFWSDSGTVMRPLRLWHKKALYKMERDGCVAEL